jgi:hypothetical protein
MINLKDFVIKQLSVFLENRPGSLASLAKAMGEAGIDILALNIAEAGEFGVVRMLVKNPDGAQKKLREMGFIVSLTNVVGVEMGDRPRELYEIAKILGESNINVEYAYACTGSTLILRVSDVEEAIKKIVGSGKKLVEKRYFE